MDFKYASNRWASVRVMLYDGSIENLYTNSSNGSPLFNEIFYKYNYPNKKQITFTLKHGAEIVVYANTHPSYSNTLPSNTPPLRDEILLEKIMFVYKVSDSAEQLGLIKRSKNLN